MKSLQTIQKTFRVFQILAKIAFILSIVRRCLVQRRSGVQSLW